MRHLLVVCVLVLLDGELIRRALRHADISLSKAALWMEMDARQLDRELNGLGHLKHTALLKLPLIFHQWFTLLQAERYGLPNEVRRSLPLYLALRGRKRMARAALALARKEDIA